MLAPRRRTPHIFGIAAAAAAAAIAAAYWLVAVDKSSYRRRLPVRRGWLPSADDDTGFDLATVVVESERAFGAASDVVKTAR